jgi:hypothetical protein
LIYTDCDSPTPAASPRAPTRCLASKKASQTPTPTTARKSPSRTTRARRVRVLLRLPSSREPFQPTVQELRTRRSEERPSRTRTKKPTVLLATSNLHVFYSTLAATVNSVARCIVCEFNIFNCERQGSKAPNSILKLFSRTTQSVRSRAVDVILSLSSRHSEISHEGCALLIRNCLRRLSLKDSLCRRGPLKSADARMRQVRVPIGPRLKRPPFA